LQAAIASRHISMDRNGHAQRAGDSTHIIPAWLRTVACAPLKTARGQPLYRAGEPFRDIFVIRYGTYKTIAGLGDSRQSITSFRICGDLMGLDALGAGICIESAIALEDGEVYVIPYGELLHAIEIDRQFGIDFMMQMSREIASRNSASVVMGSLSAEKRVAHFFLCLAERLSARGYSSTRFSLRMTRTDIGCYLGLSQETVSRAVSSLVASGLVKLDSQTDITLTDPCALRRWVLGTFAQSALSWEPTSSADNAHGRRDQPPPTALRRAAVQAG